MGHRDGQRETERERDIGTDRETERERDIGTDRETERKRDVREVV